MNEYLLLIGYAFMTTTNLCVLWVNKVTLGDNLKIKTEEVEKLRALIARERAVAQINKEFTDKILKDKDSIVGTITTANEVKVITKSQYDLAFSRAQND